MEVRTPDGLRIVVDVEGPAGAPAFVLVHGYPDTARVWDQVVPVLLDGGARVIRYDVRGAGRSDRPARTRDYRLGRLTADLLAVLDATTAPGERVHLVGHDWGALQGWEAAARTDVASRLHSYTRSRPPALTSCRRSRGAGPSARCCASSARATTSSSSTSPGSAPRSCDSTCGRGR